MSAVPHPREQLEAVVFDLDGTLVDTAGDFIPVVQQLQREFGAELLDPARIRSCVSNGARALVSLSLGLAEDHGDFEHWRQRLLTLYGEQLGQHAELYPGLSELLFNLEADGVRWGVATNKPRVYTMPLLEILGLSPESVICPQDVAQPKPHPESLFKACEELRSTPRHGVYIGDHERDIVAGRAAGMHTLAAAYGYIEPGDSADAWGADAVVAESTEIGTYLFAIDGDTDSE